MAKQHATRASDAKIIAAFDPDTSYSLKAQKAYLAALDRQAERDKREKERKEAELEAVEKGNRQPRRSKKRSRQRKWQLRRRIVVSEYSLATSRWGG